MTVFDWAQLGILVGIVLLCARPLGAYMADVYDGRRTPFKRSLGRVERWTYHLCGIDPEREMDWREWATALLIFSALGVFAAYALQRLQAVLPLNPQRLPGVRPDLAFNTAISYATNTNWQAYGGEATMSYAAQMLALTVQNFVSAAAGMAVLMALIRGLARHSARTVGNFWVDLTRGVLYILLPLSILLSVALVSQGVVQTLRPSASASLLDPTTTADGASVTTQVIAVGAAASQIAIKQLGTNGGGFFGTNSAHPFENPTPLSNLLEMVAILLIPAALCHTFGRMVGNVRQGWALLAAMTVLFVATAATAMWAEQHGNARLAAMGVDQAATAMQSGGNMEGKEVRFGAASSALWATATTAASNGSVNAMHDSLTPLAGLAAMWLMQLGEVVYGGVGSGLYGMLVFAVIAVFVAGLMVGRTPEYLGKKIEAFEIKMAALVILVPIAFSLAGTAVAVASPAGTTGVLDAGPHGFSEILYAFSSAANNNGSAFAGLAANSPFYNVSLALAMFAGRFFPAICVLAMAGSLARKRRLPASAGTLPTDTPLFTAWLIGVIVVVGALSFLPALALGPLVEHLRLGW